MILNRHEAFDPFKVRRIIQPGGTFSDIAALISYIRTIPWAFTDLDWAGLKPRLRQLHLESQSDPIKAISHRLLVSARA